MKLKNISVGDMNVDYSYQRIPNEARIKKIAREWDDILASIIEISERKDGSYYILDGNHTRLAYMSIKGADATLPCRIYTDLSIKEEADIYAKLNTSQRKPSFSEILKAKYASGDETTVAYFDSLKEAGLEYSFNHVPGKFRAHKSLLTLFKSTNKSLFVRSVKAGIRASAERDEFFQSGIFPGFCSVIITNPLLDEQRLILVAQKTPLGKIADIANMYKSGTVSGGGTVTTTAWYRNAFIDLYNQRLRTNRLAK